MAKSTKHIKGTRKQDILYVEYIEPEEKPKKRTRSKGHWKSRRNTQKRQ